MTRGQARLRAVRAMQARMLCEGLLTARSRHTPGMYDLQSHEALATWERKHDIFGWGFLGGETLGMLLRPTRALSLETFKRVLAERVADAAGIVEDGSINLIKRKNPTTWRDSAGDGRSPVPNLIDDHVNALLAAIGVATPEEMVAFLRAHKDALPGLHVAFKAPPLPEYYQPDEGASHMKLSVADRSRRHLVRPAVRREGQADRAAPRPLPAPDAVVDWHGQKIPLARWRTTIGSWRSEMHADGKVYMKYKNSDIGPRVWKTIVATPVWIPPDGTPAKDLLTTKVLDRKVGPVTIVNTGVMGPGYQSAYGLVMGIHVDPKRGGFDNQIRTHGSVDYTSIARRFSHGCHRLVNNRAVRLFDFVLRHRPFNRLGDVPLNLKKRFEVDGEDYKYAIKTRGYYYELRRADPGQRARRKDHGRGEEADHGVRAQAGRRLRRRSWAWATRRRRRRSRPPGADRSPRPDTGESGLARAGGRARARAPARGGRRARLRRRHRRAGRRRGPATDLDVTLDPDARRISGHARLRIVNDGPDPVSDVKLWLYPNVLAERSPALNDVRFHWLYPGGFSPAGIELCERRASTACRRPVAIHDVPVVGRRALARAALAAPLAPGHAVTVDVDFVTQRAAPLRRVRLRRRPLPVDGRLLSDARAR